MQQVTRDVLYHGIMEEMLNAAPLADALMAALGTAIKLNILGEREGTNAAIILAGLMVTMRAVYMGHQKALFSKEDLLAVISRICEALFDIIDVTEKGHGTIDMGPRNN